MLQSVLARHGADVHVHYMHGADVTDQEERLLETMVTRAGAKISFLRIPDEKLEGLPTIGFTRKATWYRIFLPELRPDLDRVLYLDSDLIVTDSLEPLWKIDMSEAYVAAVTNVFEKHHLGRPAELGLAGPEVYFNAGVLLMNLDFMRQHECTDALLDYGVCEAPRLLWRDQDALNVVLGDRRIELAPRWNCMNAVLLFPWSADVFGAEAVEEARLNPAIRHFEGPSVNKPWHYLCDRDLRDLYVEHRALTPWPRLRVEGVTPGNVVRRIARAATRRRGDLSA
jgi:lipopolysaccharide biosynthesis glycosyltransferase